MVYDPGFGRVYRRRPSEVLRPDDEPREVLDQLRKFMGPRDFATQYLQLPSALEGNVIRTDAFPRFDLEQFHRREFHKVIQSWDPATSEEPRADFSVCLTFGRREEKWYLFDVLRAKMRYAKLRDWVKAHARIWRADKVVIEKAGAGAHLWDDLRFELTVPPMLTRSDTDEITRMEGQLGLIEDGEVLLPREARWLDVFLSELRSFPTTRHDDQVDALSQLLFWTKSNFRYINTRMDPETGRKLEASLFDMPLDAATAVISSLLFILKGPPFSVAYGSVKCDPECGTVERLDAGLSKADAELSRSIARSPPAAEGSSDESFLRRAAASPGAAA